jgi:hypothetical protein
MTRCPNCEAMKTAPASEIDKLIAEGERARIYLEGVTRAAQSAPPPPRIRTGLPIEGRCHDSGHPGLSR